MIVKVSELNHGARTDDATATTASGAKKKPRPVGLGFVTDATLWTDQLVPNSSVNTNSGQGTLLLLPRGVMIAWYTR